MGCFCAKFAQSYIDWYFERFYHVGYILDLVWKALDERKLHYNSVVAFLQYNRPILFASDAEEFLFHCFDASGKFTRSAVAWMLWKVWREETKKRRVCFGLIQREQFGVLKPEAAPHLVEKSLFPPLPPDVLDEVRRSRDMILSGGGLDNRSLAASREKPDSVIDIDQIRASADALRNHKCQE